MHRLLVCIAFHYNKDYASYLYTVIKEFIEYRKHINVDIIIDTNSTETISIISSLDKYIKVVVHTGLAHPFHLTWMHRRHIYNRLNQYDVFMYIEGDMRLPYENYNRYLENWEKIWPDGVPVLFRVEENEGVLYNSDAERSEVRKRNELVYKEERMFVTNLEHPLPYHAMWICPQKVLKEIIPRNFVRMNKSRENAASFLIWQMKKQGYIEMDGNHVSEKSYVYHLPSNYCRTKGRLGQIKVCDAIYVVD